MPEIDEDVETAVEGRRLLQGVEIAATVTAEENRPGTKILDRETKRIKFDRNVIVTSEFADRDEIVNKRRGNEDITEMKWGGGGGDCGVTGALDGHGCAVANYDARRTGRRGGEHTSVTGHVRGGAGVENPVLSAGWRGLEGEAVERLVERRRKRAGRRVLGRERLLRSSPWTRPVDASSRRTRRKMTEGPGLDDTGPGIHPGRHVATARRRRVGGRSVGHTASAGGLLLALAGAFPAAGGGGVVGGRRSRR